MLFRGRCPGVSADFPVKRYVGTNRVSNKFLTQLRSHRTYASLFCLLAFLLLALAFPLSHVSRCTRNCPNCPQESASQGDKMLTEKSTVNTGGAESHVLITSKVPFSVCHSQFCILRNSGSHNMAALLKGGDTTGKDNGSSVQRDL